MASALALADLNAFVYPRSVRRYQQMLVQGSDIVVSCQGRVFRVVGARAWNYRNELLLECLDDNSLWMSASGEIASAYALEETLAPVEESQPLRVQPGIAVVRFGHPNFAHFLWNELDALLRLPLMSALPQHPAVLDCETIVGPADLPFLKEVSGEELSGLPSVYLGCQIVTVGAREVALQSLRREQSLARCDPLSAPGGSPVVLLGVRGPINRELANEVEFYSALIQAIRERFPGAVILLDGMTLQRDHVMAAQPLKREEIVRARIAEIRSRAGSIPVQDLSGLSFAAWVRHISNLDFYITHAGTMQHKVGWLFPKLPGVCLTHPGAAASIAQWHRDQCEEHGWLQALPDDLIELADMPNYHLPPVERDRNFRILDVASASQWVVTAMQKFIQSSP